MDKQSLLQVLGYEIRSSYPNGSTRPFVVDFHGEVAVAKIVNYTDYPSPWLYNHVMKDARGLNLAQNLVGIPRLYEGKEFELENEKFSYLIREHVEGEDILDIYRFNISFVNSLEKLIWSLHEIGIASLDLVSHDHESGMSYKHNVIRTDQDTPIYYDFGNVVFQNNERSREFEIFKEKDLADLKFITGFVK